MDTQFAKFLQIGILVENIEETIKNYEEYGIGPWRVSDFDTEGMEGFVMNGVEGAHLHTKMAFCDVWGFELELIEPITDSPYKTWVDEHGTGMHHIALITRDEFGKVLEEHKINTGRDPWLHCTAPFGMDFAYLDLKKELGMFLEVYNEEKHGGIPANFKLPAPDIEADGPIDTQFAKFLQIGILVENAEETIKNFEKYGVGPWRVSDFDTEGMEGFVMNGVEGAHLHTKMCFCDIWGFEVELIEPISDSPYKTWVDQHGSSMHHIALITRDSFDEVLAEHKRKTGRDPWLHCTAPFGMDFAYLDLKKELGLFLEVYNEEKHGGLPANFKLPE